MDSQAYKWKHVAVPLEEDNPFRGLPLLGPCPFCGIEDPSIKHYKGAYQVLCTDCGAMSAKVYLEGAEPAQRAAQLIDLWNTRAEEE